MDAFWDWLVWFWTEKLGEDSFRIDLLWGLATFVIFASVVLTWYMQSSVSESNRRYRRRGSWNRLDREVRQHLAKDLYHIPRIYRR